ncbi:MFS general substrate transporter [Neoconidiobolus thromboides FSU 785]|nr:MFS general substrate transporter [Neoconidiobolus thromboides FSU 785]
MSTATFTDQAFTLEEKDLVTIESGNINNDNQPKVVLSKNQFIIVIIALILTIFIAALDNTIIGTSLNTITSEFDALDQISWVATSYLLTSTAFQPLYGKFSDIFGRKLTTLFALSIFLIGSILCGASTNIIMLIVSRAIAGVGGGGLISLSVIIISDIVVLEKRGLYTGMVGANFAVASVVGPLLGGYLTESVSWRWCFYINVPICIVAMIVIAKFITFPSENQNLRQKLKRVDYLGSISILAFTILLVLALNWGGQEYPWNSAVIISLFILCFISLALFIVLQWKVSKEPIIPGHVLVRNVISADLTAFFNGCIFFATVVYLPIYYQIVHKESIIQSGLELLSTMSGLVFFSITSGIFIVKTGTYRLLSISGTFIGLTGVILLGVLMRNDISHAELLGFSLMIGVGVGLCLQTNTIVSQAAVDLKDAAIVTSLTSFNFSLGGVVGIAVLGSVFQNSLTSSLTREVPEVNIQQLVKDSSYLISFNEEIIQRVVGCYVTAFRTLFLGGIAFFVLSFISTLFLKHIPLKKK